MTYTDVSLAPDDVEWDDDERLQRRRVVEAAFSDRKFERFLVDHGVVVALELFTEQHRWIANQLIRAAAADPTASEWARHKISRCGRLKKRRNELRRLLTAEVGWDEAGVVIRALDDRFPRAVWGSAVVSHA